MINISKSGNAIKFVFTDSDHYLYGNGEVVVPVNSLSLVIDESEMVTFKKAATADPFISFRADNSNLGTKEAIEQFYKDNMVGSTGGGSESGMTPSEVQEMIDAATSGIPSSQVVEQLRTDVNTISGDVSNLQGETQGLWDTIDEKEEVIASALTEVRQDVADIDAKEEVIASALTEVRQNVDTLSGDVQTKVATSDFNAYSAATATAIGNKQNALQIYSENEYDEETGEDATAEIHVIGQGGSSGNGAGVYVQPYSVELSVYSEGEDPMTTTLFVTSDDVTINEERVLTEADLSAVTAVSNDLNTLSGAVIDNEYTVSQAINELKSTKLDASAYTPTDLSQYWTSAQTQTAIDGVKGYLLDLDTIMTRGLQDDEWDGAIAAFNNNRPVYVKYEGYLMIVESYILSGNEMILLASSSNFAQIMTVTKLGSNQYSFSAETKEFVTQAEKDAWNAKQDALSAGTGIEISGNVISATGGTGSGVLVINLDDLTNNMTDEKWDELVDALENDIPIFSVIDASGEDTTDIQQFPVNGALIIDENEGTSEITLNQLFGGGYYEIHIQKNGSEDYTITNDWHFVPNELSAGTGIDITDNVISCTVSGGGATYSAGTNISIDTANTINCTIPLIVTGTSSIKQASNSSISSPSNLCAVFGRRNNISTSNLNYIFMAGNNNIASNDAEAVFGISNENNRSSSTFGNSGNTLFAVGNGIGDFNRHNTIEIRQNGDLYFADTDNTTYQNYYEKPMVRLQDMYAALGGLKFVQCTQNEYDAMVSGGTVDSSTIYFITNVVS